MVVEFVSVPWQFNGVLTPFPFITDQHYTAYSSNPAREAGRVEPGPARISSYFRPEHVLPWRTRPYVQCNTPTFEHSVFTPRHPTHLAPTDTNMITAAAFYTHFWFKLLVNNLGIRQDFGSAACEQRQLPFCQQPGRPKPDITTHAFCQFLHLMLIFIYICSYLTTLTSITPTVMSRDYDTWVYRRSNCEWSLLSWLNEASWQRRSVMCVYKWPFSAWAGIHCCILCEEQASDAWKQWLSVTYSGLF